MSVLSKNKLLLCLSVIALFSLPILALAQGLEFRPLQGVPFIDNQSLSIENYINALFNGALSVAALLVVVMLILGGVEYMFTDVVNKKEDAKNKIKNALLGLLILLVSVTLLETINPQLLNLDVLDAQKIQLNSVARDRELSEEELQAQAEERQRRIDEVRNICQRANGAFGFVNNQPVCQRPSDTAPVTSGGDRTGGTGDEGPSFPIIRDGEGNQFVDYGPFPDTSVVDINSDCAARGGRLGELDRGEDGQVFPESHVVCAL